MLHFLKFKVCQIFLGVKKGGAMVFRSQFIFFGALLQMNV